MQKKTNKNSQPKENIKNQQKNRKPQNNQKKQQKKSYSKPRNGSSKKYSKKQQINETPVRIAFLGGLNPIGSILSAFFIQYITFGGGNVDLQFYCSQMSSLISSLIIYLCAFVGFFRYFIKNRIRKRDEKLEAALKEGGAAK